MPSASKSAIGPAARPGGADADDEVAGLEERVGLRGPLEHRTLGDEFLGLQEVRELGGQFLVELIVRGEDGEDGEGGEGGEEREAVAFLRLPSDRCSTTRSHASAEWTRTIRSGCWFIEVGPYLTRS